MEAGVCVWIFHDFFAYDFGGEDSRPLDLQACIVEGEIPRRARSRLGRNSASRTSNSISRNRKEFGSAHRELGHEERLLIFAWKTQILLGKMLEKILSRAKRGWKKSGIAEVQFGHEERSTILVSKYPDSAGRHSRRARFAVGKEFGMAEGNFVTLWSKRIRDRTLQLSVSNLSINHSYPPSLTSRIHQQWMESPSCCLAGVDFFHGRYGKKMTSCKSYPKDFSNHKPISISPSKL